MTKTNLKNWNTQELRTWVENVSLYSLLNINNVNIYIQILMELANRKDGVL
ncbi:MAG TPA: hypothetical protein VFC79_12275 [Tissierellaceae bacterium]|nr:hypothetical protein [Tissierellaceae bacterium]